MTVYEFAEVGLTLAGMVTQGVTVMIVLSYGRGQKEADYVKRSDLDAFKKEVGENFARRSETEQEIEALKAVSNARIDHLELRIDDLKSTVGEVKKEVTEGFKVIQAGYSKIISHLEAAAAAAGRHL